MPFLSFSRFNFFSNFSSVLDLTCNKWENKKKGKIVEIFILQGKNCSIVLKPRRGEANDHEDEG